MLETRQPSSPDSDPPKARAHMVHGQVVSAHFHHHGQLLYPSAGALATTTDKGTWVAPASRVTWTPPGFVHSHRAYGETETRLIELPTRLCRFLPDQPSIFAVTPLLREALLMLSSGRPLRPGPRHRLRGLVIDELTSAPQQDLYLAEPTDDRLRAVTALLHADPGNPATLSELGRAVGASERVLSRLFQAELGVSFRGWRTMLRIQHALVLLGESQPVTSISRQLGWANPSSFIDAFAAVFGETPGRYQAGLKPTETAVHPPIVPTMRS